MLVSVVLMVVRSFKIFHHVLDYHNDFLIVPSSRLGIAWPRRNEHLIAELPHMAIRGLYERFSTVATSLL